MTSVQVLLNVADSAQRVSVTMFIFTRVSFPEWTGKRHPLSFRGLPSSLACETHTIVIFVDGALISRS